MSTAIIQFNRGDTGKVIGDFTWDFCKSTTGTDVSTVGSTLTELGVGVYELTNPNITVRTTFSLYLTSDSTKNIAGEFDTYDLETLNPPQLNVAGYSTYLQMVNKVLKRVSMPELSSGVSTATGTAKIIAELINEAQNELWTETINWYSLYTTRDISVTSGTYAHAANYGRTIDLMDVTNNRMLIEDVLRAFDSNDPDSTVTGTPTHFSIQGGYYRFHPIPASTISVRERYWKVPGAMSDDAATSDLPLFCENYLIHWTWMSVLEYLNKFEQADRIRAKIYGASTGIDEGILKRAKTANKKMLDQMIRFEASDLRGGLQPPRFPSHY